MGRKKAQIDWRRVEQMLMAQCTTKDIAESQGVSAETLHRACKRDHKIDFEAYSRQKRTYGVTFAKEKFYQQCWIEKKIDSKSQTTKQIFWLKNNAGWADSVRQQHDGELKVKNSGEVILYLPDNDRSN